MVVFCDGFVVSIKSMCSTFRQFTCYAYLQNCASFIFIRCHDILISTLVPVICKMHAIHVVCLYIPVVGSVHISLYSNRRTSHSLPVPSDGFVGYNSTVNGFVVFSIQSFDFRFHAIILVLPVVVPVM
jgi:hypothetical protein